MLAFVIPGRYSCFTPVPAPEVEITNTLKVECTDLVCGWYEYADDEGYAIELRRGHREWHEDGCPLD